jgi:pyridoxal phosphate enzyme (YggS family)
VVAERLAAVRRRLAQAASGAGRVPDEITLVAVSKGHGVEAVRAAYDAGQRDFGENRAAELAAKAPLLPGDIRWHFIGTLQRRKVPLARPHTTLLHSLDRPSLVAAWSRGDGPAPPALVQVNLAEEPQKHGVAPGDVPALLASAAAAGITCRGLMLIPPLPEQPEQSRPWFAQLAELRARILPAWPSLTELSMGMTDDFEVAVSEGATLIRVGRAIFGARVAG